MAEIKDYRNTEYCPVLDNVIEKKKVLEEKIKTEHPKLKIIYNKVHERNSMYYMEFAGIYNNKCAYCGVMKGFLPVEYFEIDHFLNEASFNNTTTGREEAGRIDNLVLSCVPCNRGKRSIIINRHYKNLLNVDNGNITRVFKRDPDFYIQICDTYKEDTFIKQFYKSLHLGNETKRLDYLLLRLEGMYKKKKMIPLRENY